MSQIPASRTTTAQGEFEHRHAAHCESGTVATLLRTRGLDLSEPMVFGIGGGLFFFYMPLIKMGGMPLTAYRDAPRTIIKNICKRLGVRMRSHRYRDPEHGMRALDEFVEQGIPVGLQTNVFWLTYFPPDMRFQYNGHNMVAYGKSGDDYLISDPVTDKPVTCPGDALRRARFAKGAFAPKGLIYYPEHVPQNPDLAPAVRESILHTAKRMLDIPMPFFGVRGIRWLAKQLEAWPTKHGHRKASALVGNIVRMQEEIGTGGAGFRFMYAAFLQEASELLKNDGLKEAADKLSDTGDRWREFAVQGALLVRDQQRNDAPYTELAELMRECADREQEVYTLMRKALQP